jgi:hypothetical protein
MMRGEAEDILAGHGISKDAEDFINQCWTR